MHRYQPARAYSIVEVLAAATVLAIGTLGAVSTLINVTQMNGYVDDLNLATTALQDKLEEISGTTFSTLESTYTANPNFTVSGLQSRKGDTNGAGLITVTRIGGSASYLEVEVKIEWTGVHGDREISSKFQVVNRSQ